MEARDAEGDPNDLWVTFNSMGYNKGLEPDQVLYAFKLSRKLLRKRWVWFIFARKMIVLLFAILA
jgi:hypothetical protein